MKKELSNIDKEIIDHFYEAGKEQLLKMELFEALVEFEKILFEDKNYRLAHLFILDLEKEHGFKLDKKIHEEFGGWWW